MDKGQEAETRARPVSNEKDVTQVLETSCESSRNRCFGKEAVKAAWREDVNATSISGTIGPLTNSSSASDVKDTVIHPQKGRVMGGEAKRGNCTTPVRSSIDTTSKRVAERIEEKRV